MSPNIIPPEYWEDWAGIVRVGRMLNEPLPYIPPYAKKYGIATQLVAGRTLYYLPDVERVRNILATKRAEKEQEGTN